MLVQNLVFRFFRFNTREFIITNNMGGFGLGQRGVGNELCSDKAPRENKVV